MGRFIAEWYAPGRKIRRICSSLGTDYKIKRSDVKNVIWRDLGNGKALEVTGLDNLTEAVDGTIIVYEITTDKDLGNSSLRREHQGAEGAARFDI